MSFSLAEVHDAVTRAVPDRKALVFGDRPFTYGEATGHRPRRNTGVSRGE